MNMVNPDRAKYRMWGGRSLAVENRARELEVDPGGNYTASKG